MDDKDGMFLLAGFFCLLAFVWVLWKYLRPEAPIARYQVVATTSDSCQAEVWLTGQEGDRLIRLMQPHKHGPPTFAGVAVQHEQNMSSRVATTVTTPQGQCQIIRWHLLVKDKQIQSLGRIR